ncbi:Ferredoxin-NADP reductase [Halogranum amylolyticum]|uniref:Ferredoxin-NADP reductase n=1 Tax=Halogranum amylolyticum TaxID=660520 RepID=A0A1H8PEG8_9EURY|nr:FAD-dependent oxidoreductase [Halogranum amylolyticum]SEO40038.1 Ferredoxin-NADP reductase [Halogranum amylolyticum]
MDATVTVTAANPVGPDTVAIEFESPEGFDAEPGQFVKLSATIDGEGYARFYTLSSPDVSDTFEVTVGIDSEEGGPFSEFLADLGEGDEVAMSGPYGSDHYEGESRVVVLAGGPGVGPAVAIAERALADGHEAAVVYKDGDPAHEERLTALEAADAEVVVTDGDITDAVAEAVTGAEGEQVFVYGFAAFVDEALEALEAAGGDVDGTKVENFG